MVMLAKVVREYGRFDALSGHIGTAPLEDFADRIYQHYCIAFTHADYMTSVTWIVRQYLAAKKIALSALFFTQAEATRGMAMKNLTFYACYYALFNALSSCLLVHPSLSIDRAKRISHTELAKEVDNYFVRFSVYQPQLLGLLKDLRFTRELYSYHLPLSGSEVRAGQALHADALFNRLTDELPGILQISDLLSFMAYLAWEKKVGRSLDEYYQSQSEVDSLFESTLRMADHDGHYGFQDDGDYQRLACYLTRIARPSPISWFIGDKLLDDLECHWQDDTDAHGSGYSAEAVANYLDKVFDH